MNRQEFSGETVQLATRIPKSLHIRVRVRALDEGVTLADWVGAALVEQLEKAGARKRAGKGSKRAKEGAPDAA